MIDIESNVFTAMAKEFKTTHPTVYVTNNWTRQPSKLPCVMVEEIENRVVDRYSDSARVENVVEVAFHVQVFCNSGTSKKTDAKKYMSFADDIMTNMGFFRISTQPIYMNDDTMARYVAIYRAYVDKNNYIYRRR